MRRDADNVGPNISIIGTRVQIIKTRNIYTENYPAHHDESADCAADDVHADISSRGRDEFGICGMAVWLRREGISTNRGCLRGCLWCWRHLRVGHLHSPQMRLKKIR